MALVLVPGVGVERNGALRWIKLAGVQFQPSEIMKVCFVIFVAYVICRREEGIRKFWNGLVPVLFTAIPVLRHLGNTRTSKCYDDYSSYSFFYDFSCGS